MDWAGVSANIDNLKTNFKDIGKSANDAIDSFDGMGTAMTENAKKADEYTKTLQEIEDQERALALETARQNRLIAESRELAADDSKDAKIRLNAMVNANKLETDLLQKTTKLAKLKADTIRQLNELQPIDKLSDEEKMKANDALIAYENLFADAARVKKKNLNEIEKLQKLVAANDAERAREAKASADLKNMYAKTEIDNENEIVELKEANIIKIAELNSDEIDRAIKKSEEQAEAEKAIQEQRLNDYLDFVSTISNDFEALIADADATLADYGKSVLKSIITTVEAAISASLIKIIAAQFEAGATLNPVKLAAATAALIGLKLVSAKLTSELTKKAGKGYADGGYTGDGGKYEVAGNVHKGEFVITQEKTKQANKLINDIHKGSLSDSNAAEYFAANFSDANMVKEMRQIKNYMANFGYVYTVGGVQRIKQADGTVIQLSNLKTKN